MKLLYYEKSYKNSMKIKKPMEGLVVTLHHPLVVLEVQAAQAVLQVEVQEEKKILITKSWALYLEK